LWLKPVNTPLKPQTKDGFIHYSNEENDVWCELITRQKKHIQNLACKEYLEALDALNLPEDHVPQCKDVSKVLREATGWEVEPVPALINFDRFFKLLANKKFPAASFIRHREELDYLQEPDIFHEIFGHTPHLVDPRFAAFAHAYGKAGLKASKEDRVMLAKLYWFTVEFGLIERPEQGLEIYGAGLVSSMGESSYSIESDAPIRRRFDLMDALRMPYRIDIYQSIYYAIESFDELFDLAQYDLIAAIGEARKLGMHKPLHPPGEKTA